MSRFSGAEQADGEAGPGCVSVAEALLRLGMKRKIVSAVTSLSAKRVKGVAASNRLSTRTGFIPIIDRVLADDQARNQASLLCAIIPAVNADAIDLPIPAGHLCGHVILVAHKQLLAHVAGVQEVRRRISINESWVVYTAYRAGRLKVRRCVRCLTPHIATLDELRIGGCPNCERWSAYPLSGAAGRGGVVPSGTHSSRQTTPELDYQSL